MSLRPITQDEFRSPITQKDIERRYLSLCKKRERFNKKFSEEMQIFELAIKDICTHFITREYERDCDDGYGKWWKVKITNCRICGKENVAPPVYG